MAMSKEQVRMLRKARKVSGTIVGTILKILVCIIFGFPFLWMIATSFKTNAEAIRFPPTLLPEQATIDAYVTVFKELDLGRYIGNTVVILALTTIGQFLVMDPAAYAFAKYKFKGSGLIFLLFGRMRLNNFTKRTPDVVAMMNDNAPRPKISTESNVKNSEA